MISIIVAVAKNRVIGDKGDIPWYLPDDLKHFAKITKGHTVIMGRKTYESIIKRLKKPLPERKNVVITSQCNFKAPGCEVLQSVDDAIFEFSSRKEEVFVIGGSKVYEEFLPVADKLYLTEIDGDVHGDTVFPTYDEREWVTSAVQNHPMDDKHIYKFDYVELVRKR